MSGLRLRDGLVVDFPFSSKNSTAAAMENKGFPAFPERRRLANRHARNSVTQYRLIGTPLDCMTSRHVGAPVHPHIATGK